MGDLYCYNNDNYIPSNSANDQVVVTAPIDQGLQAYKSLDGTRTVKVVGDSLDAFLYDNADPATFDPVYLASGVQSVLFSDTGNGKPLQIVLKLNDGSYNMFDDYGNPFNVAGSSGETSPADQTTGDQMPEGSSGENNSAGNPPPTE